MSTLQIGLYLSYLANIVLGGIVLLYFYPQVKQSYTKYKKHRETQRDKRRQLENARLTKVVRQEVRRYLEELQK
jgi:hypothetical protein